MKTSRLNIKKTLFHTDENQRQGHAAEPDGQERVGLPGEDLRSDHREEVRLTSVSHAHPTLCLSLKDMLTNTFLSLLLQPEEQDLGERVQVCFQRLFKIIYQ